MKIKIGLSVLLVFILIQFIPIKDNQTNETNPFPVFPMKEAMNYQELEINTILKTSCYDCHSNRTNYPWYNKIAPISWYLANHIGGGKKKLNFSEWNSFTTKEKEYAGYEIIKVIEENRMPLSTYTLVHQEAKLSAEQKDVILQYFKM
tara:strand:+ start:318 stop:761 length:444 start_codon:yes stop_codon:yes gene_type:complete